MKEYIAVLFVGVAIGVFGSWSYYRHQISEHILDDVAGDITGSVNTLTLARKGDYERLIEENELRLSGAIFMMSRALPAVSLSAKNIKALLAAGRYYEKYPIASGDTNTDAEVVAFLKNVRNGKLSGSRIGTNSAQD